MDRLFEEEYGAWRQNPTTQKFLRYLMDRRTNLMECWAAGAVMDQTAQATAKALWEIAETSHADIEEFYSQEEPREDDDEESERDQTA